MTDLEQAVADRDAARAMLAALGPNPMLADFVRQACEAFRDLQALHELLTAKLLCVEIDLATTSADGRYELIVRQMIYKDLLSLMPAKYAKATGKKP